MNMEELQYIILVAMFLAFAFLTIYFVKKNGNAAELLRLLKNYISTDAFKEKVHQVMAYAEELIVGTDKGQERLLYVCGWINNHLPTVLQPVITDEILVDIVNELFEIYSEKTADGHTVVK